MFKFLRARERARSLVLTKCVQTIVYSWNTLLANWKPFYSSNIYIVGSHEIPWCILNRNCLRHSVPRQNVTKAVMFWFLLLCVRVCAAKTAEGSRLPEKHSNKHFGCFVTNFIISDDLYLGIMIIMPVFISKAIFRTISLKSIFLLEIF